MKKVIVPNRIWSMAHCVFRTVIPAAHGFLTGWVRKAQNIPDPELRRQALMSIAAKTFHCEGGALYSLLAGARAMEAARFIIAYQTISDYLDNLCDRSTSTDPSDFRALHESMLHALTPGAPGANYYRNREEQADGGYLLDLVRTCQDVLAHTPSYGTIASSLHELAGYYCDLQVHKHVPAEARVPRLKQWFESHRTLIPEMSWYEFSACAGSTLGIFCLVSCAQQDGLAQDLINRLRRAYFPWMQGLHILMDYLVDQEEDSIGGDLNFCSYYESEQQMLDRISFFFEKASQEVSSLPNPGFHTMICRGLPAIYLSDLKVKRQKAVRDLSRKILRQGGFQTWFFYLHSLLYRRLISQENTLQQPA
ncbi:MAG TPA: tetraprenyl-beta-curcumene synthase family protein [Syntrophales bacterium]|nr:tetraprenyl-beta-curcumene synthase family protein [Syntrophales bacterium]